MAYGRYGKYLKYAATAAAIAAGKGAMSGAQHLAKRGTISLANWAVRKYRGRGRKRRGTGQRPVTGQRDYRSTVTGGKRGRSFNKFRAKVRAALAADSPRQIYTALLKGSQSSATGVQNVQGIYLGDLNTTAQGDIWNIFKDAYTLAAVADAEKYKINLMSMQQETQFKNNGEDALQLSIYTLACRNDLDDVDTLLDRWLAWFGDMTAVGVVDATDVGLTPFHIPNFLRYFKIMGKTDHVIKPNEVVTVVQRKRVNRVIDGRILQDIGGARRKLTRAFFYTVKGSPENTVSTSGLTGFNLAWSNQNSYFYKTVSGSNLTDTIGQTR